MPNLIAAAEVVHGGLAGAILPCSRSQCWPHQDCSHLLLHSILSITCECWSPVGTITGRQNEP